jgi:YVTN family beta-propeller protein
MFRMAFVVSTVMTFALCAPFSPLALGQVHTTTGETPQVSLLVLAKKDQALAIVDPVTLQVIARVPVGPEPHEVIASEDGRTAWVSNYLNGSDHTITVVDLVGQRVIKTVDLGALWGPHGLFLSQAKPYFTAERAKVIGRLDPSTETVDWVLGTGQIGTHMLWVSRDGRKIVTVNVGSGTLSLLEQKPILPADEYPHKPSKQGGVVTHGKDGPQVADWDESVIKVGDYPEGFDVLADSEGNPRRIWVANAVEGTVSIIDWASESVIRTLDAHVSTANRLRFTPDGSMAVISRQNSGEVTVLHVPDGHELAKVKVGTGAAGVLISPDGARAYVSCSPDNWVRVIDLKTMQVVGRIEPGTTPDGLAWAIRR